ncbi:hypothetical protein ACIQU6_38520 [Streptomyces sp. NPDC090442]|uniref:hypothetical protein n=1 Tax=Streptomyces sp. NPDC090442 TaxID=3365962 RepID=UPI00380CFDCD
MRTSYTYSRHWDLETRQHELLGLDLGEGVSRTTLRYGAVCCGVWWGGWLLLFGFPPQPLFPLFMLPPGLLTYYGAKRSSAYWRRTNLLVWSVRAHFLLRGVIPVIGRGRIPASRLGLRLRAQRLAEQTPALAQLPAFTAVFTATPGQADRSLSSGPPVRTRPRVRMYGPDAVARARTKTRKKQAAARAKTRSRT